MNDEEIDVKLVKGLYGSEFDKNRACAFCRLHLYYLTVKQVRNIIVQANSVITYVKMKIMTGGDRERLPSREEERKN